ncbi:MAG: protein kinase, partial [Elusimicrobiota bacterium]
KRDYVAAYNSAKTALKGDSDFRPAFELMMYSESALHLRGMDALVAERTKRIMALTEKTVTHTPQEWAQAQAERPTEAGRLVRKVMEARGKGDLQAQAAFAEAAVKADPSDPMVYFQRGRARSEQGDYNGAITDLTQAMTLGWTEPVLFKLRAEALLLAERYAAAYQDAIMAIAYDAKMAVAYVLRAHAAFMLHIEQKDLKLHGAEIAEDMQTALKLDPRLGENPTYRALLEQMRVDVAHAKAGEAQGIDAVLTGAGLDRSPAKAAFLKGYLPLAAIAGLVLAGLMVLLLVRIALRSGKKAAAEESAVGMEKLLDIAKLPPKDAASRLLAGHIRIIRKIGGGGMGVVHLAEDVKLKRQVAVKQVTAALRDDPRELARLKDEALATAKLKHPNIAAIHELIEEPDGAYLVLEFIEGETLAERLSREGRLPLKDCAGIFKQVCQGIGHAHGHGVLHRDLKPSNVMVEKETGLVKIMDLGIARVTESADGRTVTTMQIGTPVYMAPEQHSGQVSRESDLYSAAVMLYELLAGKRPFDGAGAYPAKLEARFQPISAAIPANPGLDGFFKAALASKPEDRFHSAAEFLQAFEAAAAAEGKPS